MEYLYYCITVCSLTDLVNWKDQATEVKVEQLSVRIVKTDVQNDLLYDLYDWVNASCCFVQISEAPRWSLLI